MSKFSQIMKDIHKRAKKIFNGVFNSGMFKKTYREILGGEISSYWSSLKISNEMKNLSVAQIESFYSNYKSIN